MQLLTSWRMVSSISVLQALAGACDMFTGAELAGLCREAALTALREDLQVQFTYLLVAQSLLETVTTMLCLLVLFPMTGSCCNHCTLDSNSLSKCVPQGIVDCVQCLQRGVLVTCMKTLLSRGHFACWCCFKG